MITESTKLNSEYLFHRDDFQVTPKIQQNFNKYGYILSLLDNEEVEKVKKVFENATSEQILEDNEMRISDGQGREAKLIVWSHPGNDVSGIVSRSQKVAGTCEKVPDDAIKECENYTFDLSQMEFLHPSKSQTVRISLDIDGLRVTNKQNNQLHLGSVVIHCTIVKLSNIKLISNDLTQFYLDVHASPKKCVFPAMATERTKLNSEYLFYRDDFQVTPKMKQSFDKYGYILVRRILDNEEVEKVKKVFENATSEQILEDNKMRVSDGQGREAKLIVWSHPGNDVSGMVSRSQKVAGTCEKVPDTAIKECENYTLDLSQMGFVHPSQSQTSRPSLTKEQEEATTRS
ncbi:unnamed protein product [Mytilus edulis]|uniref:Uncharacterized protein n=1 Tax=Mytilus edulis TaxID=6550 RepID=A0A8S3U1I0_MYTED|nr:unnamed protein product [Mytilus edulis]